MIVVPLRDAVCAVLTNTRPQLTAFQMVSDAYPNRSRWLIRRYLGNKRLVKLDAIKQAPVKDQLIKLVKLPVVLAKLVMEYDADASFEYWRWSIRYVGWQIVCCAGDMYHATECVNNYPLAKTERACDEWYQKYGFLAYRHGGRYDWWLP